MRVRPLDGIEPSRRNMLQRVAGAVPDFDAGVAAAAPVGVGCTGSLHQRVAGEFAHRGGFLNNENHPAHMAFMKPDFNVGGTHGL